MLNQKTTGQKSKFMLVFFFFALFSFWGKAEASNIGISATINSSGVINFTGSNLLSETIGDDGGGFNCVHFYLNKGTYPVITNQTTISSGSCAFFQALTYQDFLTNTGNYPTFDAEAVINNFSLGDGNYWIQITGDDSYYMQVYRTGGAWVPSSGSYTHFTSFTYNNTTQMATVEGYWNATSTPFVHETLQFWQDSSVLGRESYAEKTATTSGYFVWSFFYHGIPQSASSTIASFSLIARIYQIDARNETELGGFSSNSGIVTTLLTATSTTIGNTYFNGGGIEGDVDRTYSFEECSLRSLDIGLCLGDVFVALFQPLPQDWQYISDQLYENVRIRFPLGYINDFISIISTTTEGTLTPIDAVIPSVLPGSGTHMTLSLAHVLDPMLNATTSQFANVSASSTETFGTITERYWDYLVYALTLLYLLSRILGTRMIPNGLAGATADTNSGDDSYRLKEYLYEHRKR